MRRRDPAAQRYAAKVTRFIHRRSSWAARPMVGALASGGRLAIGRAFRAAAGDAAGIIAAATASAGNRAGIDAALGGAGCQAHHGNRGQQHPEIVTTTHRHETLLSRKDTGAAPAFRSAA